MTDAGNQVVSVRLAPDSDNEELARLTGQLRVELLDLDVQSVDPVSQPGVPEEAKGLPAVAGWLAVHLGSEGLRAVLAMIADWAFRNDRAVEVRSGGDVLKLARATREEQGKIIDAWLAEHTPGA